ncbi:MAG: outer membrane beta-barrel protein [Bacteroidales bacterium]|nr:outer membrane beta-barrel protein [Bacteroidales bacterium]
MRKIFTLLMAATFLTSAYTQENDTTRVKVGKKNIVTVTDDDNGTNVRVLDDEVIVDVKENQDTVKIKIGNKGISITETDNGTNVEIIDLDDFERHGWRKKDKFTGHWAGYELGLNNYLTSDFKFAGSDNENLFLDLNTGKSWNANINFMQYSLPMSRSIGWTTGLGFEWNNYSFDGNNAIGKDSIGNIGPVYPPDGAVYTKSKMNTTYLTLPLLLEFQFGKSKKGFFSVGVIGGLKLHSNIKTIYDYSGSKERNKVKDDFNLNPLRYAVTVRAGYKFIKLYANYGMMPLFQDNRGPEVYPINVGLILCSFR